MTAKKLVTRTTGRKKGLNDKQRRFAQEYLKDLNGTQAAIRAGYSKRTAYAQANDLLRKPEIKAYLQSKADERSQRVGVDADYVLQRTVEIDRLDVADIVNNAGNVLPVNEWPKAWRTSISGIDLQEVTAGGEEAAITIIRKIKMPDKVKNIEMMGRHVTIQAWKDRTEMDLTDKAAALIDARKRVESVRQ